MQSGGTESPRLKDRQMAIHTLKLLRQAGYWVAIDGFGSAYSALNVLSQLPLDILKIDRGFLQMTRGEQKQKAYDVLESVMILARRLSLETVAEGVETAEQYEFLKTMGCNYIQGNYFSPPIQVQSFRRLLEHQVLVSKSL